MAESNTTAPTTKPHSPKTPAPARTASTASRLLFFRRKGGGKCWLGAASGGLTARPPEVAGKKEDDSNVAERCGLEYGKRSAPRTAAASCGAAARDAECAGVRFGTLNVRPHAR